MSRKASGIILAELESKPEILLCASAGSSPSGVYAELAKRFARSPGAFASMRLAQIDEWIGLFPTSAGTCKNDLDAKLIKPLKLEAGRVIAFRSDAGDPKAECERVARRLVDEGRIDLCVLGLGANGHIAMNEPAAALSAHAHVAKLSPASRRHPMLAGLARKPRFGMTLGMSDILCSRRILLLVSGAHKRAALKRLLQPEVTTAFPASLLWVHPDVTLLCDREASPR